MMEAVHYVEQLCQRRVISKAPQQFDYCPQISAPSLVASTILNVDSRIPWEHEQRRLVRGGKHHYALCLKPTVKVCKTRRDALLSVKRASSTYESVPYIVCVNHQKQSLEYCVQNDHFAEKLRAAKIAGTSNCGQQFPLLIRNCISNYKSRQKVTEDYETYQCLEQLLSTLEKIKVQFWSNTDKGTGARFVRLLKLQDVTHNFIREQLTDQPRTKNTLSNNASAVSKFRCFRAQER
ncbi:hypothetical protein D915_007593 [Fasciola hepatica]|uniref:Uncharacterized protein n=1 Tax=Fasciola hepatica TaxID=6192 RepID=A0A4E0R181_FASHE|nr:hypothetical protein D915_007593 [Fasciola hepatica]